MSIQARIFLLCFAAFLGGAGLVIAPSNEASAQADPNIQSRIETFSAPFVVQPVRPQVGEQSTQTVVETGGGTCVTKLEDDKCIPTSKIDKRVSDILQRLKLDSKILDLTPADPADRQRNQINLLNQNGTQKYKLKLFALAPINVGPPKKPGGPRQPTVVKFSFPFNPTYETNVLKTSTNPRDDTSIGFGGGVQVTAQGLRDLDVIAFSAGIGVNRLSNLTPYRRPILTPLSDGF